MFRTALIVALSFCWPAAGVLAQERTGVEGVWSTAFTARDHPEWTIADYLCLLCPPVAHEHLRRLLADPANDRRPLQELGQEATRVGNEHRTRLMTDTARERLKQHAEAANDAVIRCEPPDLLTLLRAPQPIAITVRDNRVIIHHDHWNTVRTIGIGGRAAAPAAGAPTRLGTATARVDGSTLVVESRDLLGTVSPVVTTTDGATVVERWTAANNGARLNLELVVTDPASYREPFVLTQARVRTPNEKMLDLPPCEAVSGQR
jgi:hypothetical protein